MVEKCRLSKKEVLAICAADRSGLLLPSLVMPGVKLKRSKSKGIVYYLNMKESKCKVCETVMKIPLMDGRPAVPTPFDCPSCGRINFNMQAKWDYVFIWPLPFENTFKYKGKIIRPPNASNPADEIYGRSEFGIVLSFGPGYVGKDNKYHPTPKVLEVGMKVVYDKFVPTRTYEKGVNGENVLVVICGFNDVYGKVIE